ncbi:MAG: thiolase family protein [Verrucomicrobia bacterium]|nr:thiolase family protein [Verrucomicrobiota bacterium]
MNTNTNRICIVAAKRTPQGKFLGALSGYSALQLGGAAARAALAGLKPEHIDLAIVGHCLAPDNNLARQVSREAGVPLASPAYTVNMACASGMKAVMLAADAIRLGHATVVLAGGAESMSNAPHLMERARTGTKLGHLEIRDSLLDGLTDLQLNEGMGLTAERLAEQYKVSRREQDEFACRSHAKAIAAQDGGVFDAELAALPELARDEQPRRDSTFEKLSTLKPAFKPDGTVTPGNSSGINDGAAMLVLCDEKTAAQRGWKPLAYLKAAAQVGCDPRIMGIGPVPATEKLCAQSGIALKDFDAIEINEAFAAQVLACTRGLKLAAADSRLNPHGGGISLGHPLGATGARLLVHLAHLTARGQSRQSLATLCVGGGQGVAVAVAAME